LCEGDPVGLKLFATNEFIAALKRVEKFVATNEEAKTQLESALKLLQDSLERSTTSLDDYLKKNQHLLDGDFI
jgi:hypothetical protein